MQFLIFILQLRFLRLEKLVFRESLGFEVCEGGFEFGVQVGGVGFEVGDVEAEGFGFGVTL